MSMLCIFCGLDPGTFLNCCDLGAMAYNFHGYRDEDEFSMSVGELREIMRRMATQRWEIERRDRKIAKVAGIARLRIARIRREGISQ